MVIVDQTMPGLSGLEVLRAMAARGAFPPTVMVTGTGNERIAVEAMKLGVSDYLVKDLEGGFVHVLPLVVSRAIDQRRLLLEKQRMSDGIGPGPADGGDRPTGGGHRPRDQHPHPIHRRQRPLPPRRLWRDQSPTGYFRASVGGRPHRFIDRRRDRGSGGEAPRRRSRLLDPRDPPGHPTIAGGRGAREQHRRRHERVLASQQRAEAGRRSEPRHRRRRYALLQRSGSTWRR